MSAARFFIVIRAPNGDVREVPLTSSPVVIGRDESADVQVEDKKVSRRHAAFKLVDGVPTVEDLGSINGVKLNGEKISEQAEFSFGDQIRIGGYAVALLDDVEPSDTREREDESGVEGALGTARVALAKPEPSYTLRLLGRSEPVDGKVFELAASESIVGRLDECDVVLLHPSVSRQHARIIFRPEEPKLTVHDLDSANGVFVNRRRVRWADLRPKDALTIGGVRFDVAVEPPLEFRKPPAREAVGAVPAWAAAVLGLIGIAVAASVLVLALWGKSDLADRWSHVVAWFGSEESTERSELELPVSEIARSSESDASKAAGSRPLGRTAADEEGVSSAPAPRPQKAFRDRTNLASVLNRPVTPVTYTATAPYTRRSADGLPAHLPAVDPDLDLAAEVKAGLRQARQAEAAADYEGLKKALDRVLELDPLHPKALELRDRAALYQLAEKALERAKELEQAGKVAEAYRVLDQVPEQMPLRPEAERRSSALRKRALDDALERSGRALRAKRLEDAHRWATFVLSLEPDHAMALARVRSAERLMRKRKMSYDAYRPKSAPVDESTTDGLEGAIRRQFPDRPGFARVLLAYARGDVESALRAARRVAPSERQAARRAAEQVRKLKQRYDRVRTEVSNDPSRAWSLLLSLKKAEAKLLPEGSKSYLVRELEVALSDAFSERGASRFREERYEEAYRKWQAGYRLDPTHPEIRSGLARLEQVARKMAQEAELLGQRGDDGACALWRRITQTTRPESDIHRKARQRAARVCL